MRDAHQGGDGLKHRRARAACAGLGIVRLHLQRYFLHFQSSAPHPSVAVFSRVCLPLRAHCAICVVLASCSSMCDLQSVRGDGPEPVASNFFFSLSNGRPGGRESVAELRDGCVECVSLRVCASVPVCLSRAGMPSAGQLSGGQWGGIDGLGNGRRTTSTLQNSGRQADREAGAQHVACPPDRSLFPVPEAALAGPVRGATRAHSPAPHRS
jgi:hypothetical protein